MNSSTTELPEALTAFLARGGQLSYDEEDSTIGRIQLKSLESVTQSTIEIEPSQEVIDDPYEMLDGRYQVEVFDLIATSERYNPEGLFCWINVLKAFGCIDSEHGMILSFADATWEDIVSNPRTYLDCQWGLRRSRCEEIWPWLHFPFQLRDGTTVIQPYPRFCRLHQRGIAPGVANNPETLPLFQRRELESWLRNYLSQFPYAGVPVNQQKMLFCTECRRLELAWLEHVEESDPPVEVTPNSKGWVLCPGCGIRFSTQDKDRFRNGMHMACGQKIRLRENPQ